MKRFFAHLGAWAALRSVVYRRRGVGCSISRDPRDRTRNALRVALVLGLGLLLTVEGGQAQTTPQMREAAVKASVLLNFSLYVDYPESAFGTEVAPVEICVVDPEALQSILERLAAAKERDGRSYVVRRITPEEVEGGCQLLYFGQLSRKLAKPLLERVAELPMLTVGEDRDFLEDGGAVRLMRVGNNVRFAINRDAIADAGLGISSAVLRLAEQVVGGEGKGRGTQ